MIKMQIFEPAMCCSTGLCGVGVDPELLRISTVLSTLKTNGVEVDRFNLSSAPQEFVNNSVINEFITKNGVNDLPATIIDSKIVITGRYPSNEELVQLLNVPMSFIGQKPKKVIKATVKKTEGCGCSGGNCC
jgi:hypothetical protein